MIVAIGIGDVHVNLILDQHTGIVNVSGESILSRENMEASNLIDSILLGQHILFPAPMHEGHGRASYYVNDRVNEEQFDPLSKIIVGEAGEGPLRYIQV